MSREIDIRIGEDVWPGSTSSMTLLPDRAREITEVRARVVSTIVNTLGVRIGSLASEVASEVGEVVSPDTGVRIDLPVPATFPPSQNIGGSTVSWKVSVSIITPSGQIDQELDFDVSAAPAGVTAEELVDPGAASKLLRKRRRVRNSVGSTGFVIALLLGMAIGFPIAFTVADGDAEAASAVGLSMGIMLMLLLANRQIYGHRDVRPFSIGRSIARRSDRVRVELAAPTDVDVNIALITRFQETKGSGSRTKTKVEWATAILGIIGRGGLALDVEVPDDAAPTTQRGRLEVDHWIRVQPASSVGSDPRFQRDRSDRPVIVVN